MELESAQPVDMSVLRYKLASGNRPVRVFEQTALGRIVEIESGMWSREGAGFKLHQVPAGPIWAQAEKPGLDDGICTVHLPAPYSACVGDNGADVKTPEGESIPNILKVTIDASAGEFVETTVCMLARVDQAEG